MIAALPAFFAVALHAPEPVSDAGFVSTVEGDVFARLAELGIPATRTRPPTGDYLMVVFDDDVDVQDVPQAAWRAFANVDAKRDVVIVDGPVDALDHAAPHFAFGAKIGVDATRKWIEEGGREGDRHRLRHEQHGRGDRDR